MKPVTKENPFGASTFAKKIFKHRSMYHYSVSYVVSIALKLKRLIFYVCEIPETYFSDKKLSTGQVQLTKTANPIK